VVGGSNADQLQPRASGVRSAHYIFQSLALSPTLILGLGIRHQDLVFPIRPSLARSSTALHLVLRPLHFGPLRPNIGFHLSGAWYMNPTIPFLFPAVSCLILRHLLVGVNARQQRSAQGFVGNNDLRGTLPGAFWLLSSLSLSLVPLAANLNNKR
jgi:hypothetical protein